MSLSEYFENNEGTGILATSDTQGNVDLAVYARPHIEDEQTVILIMSDKLSHSNLAQNPKAAYMFIEKGPGYKGKRIYLEMIRQDSDPELVQSLRRRKKYDDEGKCPSGSTAVYFKITNTRPLVGD